MSLESYFEQYPHVTIKKLAQAAEIPYDTLWRYSRKPASEAPQRPQKHNYTAMEQLFKSRKVDWTKLDWESMNTPVVRRGIPLQKDLDKWNVGDKVYLRQNHGAPYTILYKTPTHIVVMLDGTTEPLAWSNRTFLSHGPSFVPRGPQSHSKTTNY